MSTAMTTPTAAPVRPQELTALLPLCGTLAGLCIGIVAFINGAGRGAGTWLDDVLATCAATFVLCIYLITWALRAQAQPRVEFLTKLVEVLFLATLTVMTITGFVMVYTVW
jgi:hypothetical protein